MRTMSTVRKWANDHVDEILEAVEDSRTTLSSPGFCTSCGAEAYGVEPDARGYKCEECNVRAVYGAEELILYVY
jgi:hypothetical protein